MSNINSADRFIRWQTNLRNQVSFTNNLLLTFSVGILGFIFNILADDKMTFDCISRHQIDVGLILILFSVIIGVLTNISRIIDFRLTLKKIKLELEKEGNLDKIKWLKNTFGNITWLLFYGQILTLTIGFIYLSIGLYKSI